MVDQEGCNQHDEPSRQRKSSEEYRKGAVRDAPDDGGRRPPKPKDQIEDETGEQNKSTPLHRLGNDSGPPVLEALPCHDAVLHGEESQQRGIDQNGGYERARLPGVDGFRDRKVADKSNRVKKAHEE